MREIRLAVLLALTAAAQAQTAIQGGAPWVMQDSGTGAGLRGIYSVDGTVAWASGTGGTVLRTVDGGAHWTRCATPDGGKDGATLDFRGVQAWGAETAIVMASGPGEKSRLYKTSDGCGTWMLVFKNPDSPAGFFDSFWLNAIDGDGLLVGDSVKGLFTVFKTEDAGVNWARDKSHALRGKPQPFSAFAASNGTIGKAPRGEGDARGPGIDAFPGFVTGGKGGSLLIENWNSRPSRKLQSGYTGYITAPRAWRSHPVPLSSGFDSCGAFALALRYTGSPCEDCGFGRYWIPIVVGGDYAKPNESAGTAAWSSDGGMSWTASTTPPHGYRSTVQYSDTLKLWITAGTNGSDISRDDGKTWQPLDNGNWNALSLPFIVGPQGRIARLNPSAIPLP